ncbi:MAG: amidohydrolase family protein [Planctomycetes bacterium]|nr:amidohydrolase family protein [Planctomycetota bacterium]
MASKSEFRGAKEHIGRLIYLHRPSASILCYRHTSKSSQSKGTRMTEHSESNFRQILSSIVCLAGVKYFAVFALAADSTSIPMDTGSQHDPIVVIEDCSLFDSQVGQFVPRQTVVINKGMIESVSKYDPAASFSDESLKIDGREKFLLPGLIDAHVHVAFVLNYAHVSADEVLPLYLAAGVTSVRSTGDDVIAGTLAARYADAHPNRCPRVFTCSPLIDADPPIHKEVGKPVTDAAQIPSLLDDLLDWKVRTLKIYAGTGREVGKAVIDEGHRRGFLVTAHLGKYSAQDAVADGVDCLEHIWSVFNYVIPPDMPRTAGYRGRIDFQTPLCQDLIKQLVDRKVVVDPTLSVFRQMILLPDIPEVADSPDNKLVPQRLRDFWPTYLRRTGCPHGGALEDRQREFAKYQELTGLLHRAGVPILVGTDSPEPHVTPGYSLHTEMELLVESGMSPASVLQAATLQNARILREEDRLGTISPGKQADLVLLKKNPVQEIGNSRSIELVIRGGKVCYPAEVLEYVSR